MIIDLDDGEEPIEITQRHIDALSILCEKLADLENAQAIGTYDRYCKQWCSSGLRYSSALIEDQRLILLFEDYRDGDEEKIYVGPDTYQTMEELDAAIAEAEVQKKQKRADHLAMLARAQAEQADAQKIKQEQEERALFMQLKAKYEAKP